MEQSMFYSYITAKGLDILLDGKWIDSNYELPDRIKKGMMFHSKLLADDDMKLLKKYNEEYKLYFGYHHKRDVKLNNTWKHYSTFSSHFPDVEFKIYNLYSDGRMLSVYTIMNGILIDEDTRLTSFTIDTGFHGIRLEIDRLSPENFEIKIEDCHFDITPIFRVNNKTDKFILKRIAEQVDY